MKICNKCGILKDLDDFAKQKQGKQGRRASCKQCVKNTYRNSKKGLVKDMYNNQRHKSKKRGHVPPNYTEKELYTWITSQPDFNQLYEDWEKSNYKTDLRPSGDRDNDYKPYTLCNLTLTTWEQNSKRYREDAKAGINTKSATSVNQYDLQGNFIKQHHSLASAAREVSTSAGSIRNAALGNQKTAKNYIWKF